MTLPERRMAIAAAALAVATIGAGQSVATPAAAAGAPPFCIQRGGGGEGSSPPQMCAYYDYQACLQAAADLRGNCVQNIDYHGEVSTAPSPSRTRHRR